MVEVRGQHYELKFDGGKPEHVARVVRGVIQHLNAISHLTEFETHIIHVKFRTIASTIRVEAKRVTL